ncbi:hypothetical protein PALB_11840 [Pseudoalteromonas luteoviolacea B = ATCC 29581]|nr:hypothetical protein PALB_11840 [Pseudoalteromonas luteoviolacea B = ATCC 29581]
MNRDNVHKHSAFTLLEVLIASVILFSAIALMTVIYRGSLNASNTASAHLKLNTPVRSIIQEIKSEITNLDPTVSDVKGNEGVAFGVKYSWSATIAKSGFPPKQFDPDMGSFIDAKNEFRLWNVTLELEYNNKKKVYSYQELGWVINAR